MKRWELIIIAKAKCRSCNEVIEPEVDDVVYHLDRKKDKLHVFKIIEKTDDGRLRLRMMSEEKEPLKVRRRKASEIVDKICDELKKQVPGMVRDALIRHDVDEMEAIERDLKRGITPKLKSTPGCVSIETSEGDIHL